jgi:hypothetical protein
VPAIIQARVAADRADDDRSEGEHVPVSARRERKNKRERLRRQEINTLLEKVRGRAGVHWRTIACARAHAACAPAQLSLLLQSHEGVVLRDKCHILRQAINVIRRLAPASPAIAAGLDPAVLHLPEEPPDDDDSNSDTEAVPAASDSPRPVSIVDRRKIRKNTQEKKKRLQFNSQFEVLRKLLRVGQAEEKQVILASAVEVINVLFSVESRDGSDVVKVPTLPVKHEVPSPKAPWMSPSSVSVSLPSLPPFMAKSGSAQRPHFVVLQHERSRTSGPFVVEFCPRTTVPLPVPTPFGVPIAAALKAAAVGHAF